MDNPSPDPSSNASRPARRRRRRRRIRASSGRRSLPTAKLAAPLFLVLALTAAVAGPGFRASLRQALTSPNLVLPLLLAGILLLYLEFNRPGAVLPAALGTLAVTLALFGLAQLPLNPAALVAIAAALALLACELVLPLRNLAAAVAAAILAWGLARLVHNPAGLPAEHLPVHPAVALITAFTFVSVTLVLGRIALRARRNKRIQSVTAAAPARLQAG